MDFSSIFLKIIVTAIAYMTFPLIKLLSNNGRFPKNRAHKIALWNSIVVGVFFCIATIEVTGTATAWNAAPAVLYYWINKAILKKKDATETAKTPTEPIESEIVSAPDKVEIKRVSPPQHNCSETKSTSMYKRQEKVGSIITILVLSVLVFCLGGLNVIQYINAGEYETQIEKLQEENSEYKAFWSQNEHKVDFYDANIVFVIEGYGNYYYTYDQMFLVTLGKDEYSYWAYNKEQAIHLGYEAWK